MPNEQADAARLFCSVSAECFEKVVRFYTVDILSMSPMFKMRHCPTLYCTYSEKI